MIAVCLIMIVKTFPFLIAVSTKKCGVNVEKHEFRFLYGIDDFTKFAGNLVQLTQCIFIHAVKKARQGRLGR